MIRSPNISIIDKAIYLWVLCTIEWMQENNEPVSNNNLDRLFGEYERKRINFYRGWAMDNGDVTPGGNVLTDNGKNKVRSWRRYQSIIFDQL